MANDVIQINGFTITSLEQVHAYSRVADATTSMYTCAFILDELKSTTISNTEDTTDITGKGDRILKQIKKNKSVTVSGESALISGGLMAAQTGSEEETGNVTVRYPDYVTLTADHISTGITLANIPTGTAGHEIVDFRIISDNGALTSDKFSQGTTAGASVFKVSISGNKATLTLPTDATKITVGTKVVIIYDFVTTGSKVVNKSDVFGKTLKLVVDCLGTDVCDNEYKCQFIIPRAQFSGAFDVDMGGDQTVQSFEATTLVDTCKTSSQNELFEFIVYKD